MTVSGFLYTLASVPMFASRPFLAAWMTAMLARFGTSIPWLQKSAVIQALHMAPDWFRSGPLLAILAALALVEVLAVKHAEVRDWLAEFDGLIKSGVALLVSFAVVDAQSAEILETIQKSGLFSAGPWSLFVGALVFGAAALRRGVLRYVNDIDGQDDIGLQSALNWAENAWTIVGLVFLVIFPIAAVCLSALTTFGIWHARRRAERKEEESRVACTSCGARILPSATRCFACRSEVVAPRAIGVFGQPQAKPARDLARHRFELVSRKRCPDCAARLEKRAVRQRCETCGRVTFASTEELQDYLDALSARLPRVLAITAALGAIPLLGVVPALLYYRLNLVTGLRGYIPPLRGCTTRLVVRVIHFAVIALQPIPIVGALLLPLMAYTTYSIYRRSLVGRARDDLAVHVAVQTP